MTLQPPRVLIVPHPDSLCMPGLVFRIGIPAADIHIVHSAVMERGSLKFVTLSRRKSRRHVTNAYDGQLAYLTRLYKVLHLLGVPSITQIEVHRAFSVGAFLHLHHLPLVFSLVGQGFLAYHMFAALLYGWLWSQPKQRAPHSRYRD